MKLLRMSEGANLLYSETLRYFPFQGTILGY